MKRIKLKLMLFVFVVLSLFLLAGNSWSTISLPVAFFNGLVETYLDNGVDDDLNLLFTTINSVVYLDGSSTGNPADDSIIGSTVTITGAKRTPLAVPGTTFTDATFRISDGTTTYFSAILTNIEFVQISGLWRLNPGLDKNNPATLNLKNVLLNPGPVPSAYIIEMQKVLGGQTVAGVEMTLNTFSGDITGDSQNAILEGLIDGVPPIPAPTMTEWGMIIFMIFAGLGAVYVLWRKKRTV